MIGVQQRPYSQYRDMQVLTATPEKLTAMLYEFLVRSMEKAQDAIERSEPKEAHNHLIKAQDCLGELQASLDYEQGGEIARVLGAIYEFLQEQLFRANLEKSPAILPRLIPVAKTLRDGWREMLAGGKAIETRG